MRSWPGRKRSNPQEAIDLRSTPWEAESDRVFEDLETQLFQQPFSHLKIYLMDKPNATGIEPRRRVDVYQLVTDRIVAALDQGIIPWRKTWQGHLGHPRNYLTHHRYRGINAILTGLTPFSHPYFLTLAQANKLGGKIKKGAQSLPIVYWKVSYKDESGAYIREEDLQEGQAVTKQFFARYYRVFNVEDVEGIPLDFPAPPDPKTHYPLTHCEAILQRMPRRPVIREGGDKAYYSPPTDVIRIPRMDEFDSSEAYYATLFHELVHSTGHESRLARAEVMERHLFGSCDYSKEELTAEMGAAFLCSLTGIDHPEIETNAVAYIQSWLKALENDKTFVFHAASKAQKAADYICGEIQPQG